MFKSIANYLLKVVSSIYLNLYITLSLSLTSSPRSLCFSSPFRSVDNTDRGAEKNIKFMKYMSPTSIANHNVVQDNYENIKFNSPTSLVLSVHSASLCSVPIMQIMTQRKSTSLHIFVPFRSVTNHFGKSLFFPVQIDS